MASKVSHLLPNLSRCSNYRLRPQQFGVNITYCRYYATGSDNKDLSSDSQNKEEGKEKQCLVKQTMSDASKDAAKKKLMDLLTDIKIAPHHTKKESEDSKTNLRLTKPLPLDLRKKHFGVPKKEDSVIDPQEILKASIKEVARNLKGDPAITELELTEKLNSMEMSTSSDEEELKEERESMKQRKEQESESIISEEMSEKIMSSVKDVASTVEAVPDPVQSELAKRLLQFATEQKKPEEQKQILLNLFKDLKIERKVPDDERMASAQKYASESKDTQKQKVFKRVQKQTPEVQIDLFGASPLNIFMPPRHEEKNERNLFWEQLEKHHLKLLVQYAPSSAFEEMIMWTEQGRHWKFPIDNECDMGAEEKVGFHEHVFLDHYIEDFPKTGPIRHFMELVVTGLSKNPYITVERKVENINWFRIYFKEKEDIINEYLDTN